MSGCGPVDLGRSPFAVLHPVDADSARIEDGFWARRQRLNRDVLLPDGRRRLEEAGNLDNLRRAARGERGGFRGMVFADSDVHKWLEAAGWELQREPSDALAAAADELIALLAGAQDDDGYLNSYFQLMAEPDDRFTRLAWDHELYCAGHLIQAAVAHARGRGDEALLGVARRLAEHIDGVFGPGRRRGTPGHPEVETALVELFRLTGERRWLHLAAFFVDERGHGTLAPATFGASYFPDHVPVRQQREIAGHAVRALYLAAGVTDLHLETGERALLDVMEAQWEDMTARKAYLTGGVGAHHQDEAFGDPYELPPDRCYGETCAAIASVMWSWRMLLATGAARYADLMERTLYNGFLAGLALDGAGYSYVNPLQVRDEHRDPVERGARRRAWYECACCPPNVMRLLASLHHYVATASADGLQIHQYASGRFGAVSVRTGYPWDGRIDIEVLEPGEGEWTLSLRVPAWAAGTRLTVGASEHDPAEPGGYARVRRRWSRGDHVVLDLPMAPRLVAPHPRIDAVRGCLAIERGPLVYCVEHADAPAGARLDDLRLDPAAPLAERERPDLLGGIVAVEAGGRHRPAPADGWPYARADPAAGDRDGDTPVTLTAVPYALWGNRGDGAMRVWTPAA
jgi:uncharacterized protein